MRKGATSRTAGQNALFRALEAKRSRSTRVADDPLAAHFLPPRYRFLAVLGSAPPLRLAIERVIDKLSPVARAGVIARTRLIDETIEAELPSLRQVVLLGAGFDSRAFRLSGMKTARVFEVDHPATQEEKRRSVARATGGLPPHVTFVPVEFGRDHPLDELERHGFELGVPTLMLWEGVTNYLDEDAVNSTFDFISASVAAGSPVLFTYVDRRILDGSVDFEGAQETMRAVRRAGEPFTFGFHPESLPSYLEDRALRLEWDAAVSDIAARVYPANRRHRAPAYYHVALARRN